MQMKIIEIVWAIAVASIALYLLAFLFCIYFLIKNRLSINKSKEEGVDRGALKRGLLVFCIFLLIPIATFQITNYFYVSKLESILDCRDLEIIVDGRIAKNPATISKALKSISRKKLSGSRPTVSHEVFIRCDNERLELYFKRDSRDSNLYWVYPDLPLHGGLGYIAIENLK